MKFMLIGSVFAVCLAGGLVLTQQESNAGQAAIEQIVDASQADPVKKCGFDSDCPHGKCKSGKCGGCGFDSDCKGWGKCKSGQCGACGFDSDCKGFGKCKSGKCSESPY